MAKTDRNGSTLSFDSKNVRKAGSNVVSFEARQNNNSSEANNKNRKAFEKLLKDAKNLNW